MFEKCCRLPGDQATILSWTQPNAEVGGDTRCQPHHTSLGAGRFSFFAQDTHPAPKASSHQGQNQWERDASKLDRSQRAGVEVRGSQAKGLHGRGSGTPSQPSPYHSTWAGRPTGSTICQEHFIGINMQLLPRTDLRATAAARPEMGERELAQNCLTKEVEGQGLGCSPAFALTPPPRAWEVAGHPGW